MPARDDEVQSLVESLSEELRRSVLVDDAGLRLLAYSPSQGTDDEVRRTAILTRATPREVREAHFSQGIAHATTAVRTAARPELGLQARVCVPIRCQGTLFGYLWLIDADESLRADQCELAERCAAEIGDAMYRREELERPRRELERRALDALLGADPAQRAEAARALVAEDLLVAGSVAVLAARPAGEAELGPADKARLGVVLDQFRRTLPSRHSLSVVRGDHAIVLVALDPHAPPPADIARRLHEVLEHAVVGYSEPREHLADAHLAHEHARLALKVAACAREHPSPAGWADLGAYRMLARAAESPGALDLLHPGIPELFALQAKESLVATLETYLDNGCDTKLTAEALFLHRASLYYRLQRIEALTGASLKSGADRLALHASLKLARLLGLHPALRAGRTGAGRSATSA